MKLNELSPAPGSTHSPIRVGRGIASGKGKTSAVAIKVKNPVPAVVCVLASKVARCLYPVVCLNVVSLISGKNR